MAKKRTIALLLAVTLVSAAGLAAAGPAIMPRSIWGSDNPGQGFQNANMPDVARENNRAGPNHEDNRGGDGSGDENETEEEEEEEQEEEEEEQEEEEEEQEEEEDDLDENETGEEEEEDTESLAVMHALSVIEPMSARNSTDGNWSRNWTHGNVTCAGSGNKTSGTITCSWPDYNFRYWGLNCSISAGSFTKTWSPGNVTWNRTGGDIACTWSWPSRDSGSSSGSATTTQADRSGTSG